MFVNVGVRRETHELMKTEAERRGVKICDLYGKAAEQLVANPLGDFLKAALDICYSDFFEVGPDGWETTPEAFAELPQSVKQLVYSTEPTGDGRLKVEVVSKRWAMETAAKLVLQR